MSRLVLLAAALLAGPAQAQPAQATLPQLTPPPGVLGAEVGKTIVRPAGKPGATVEVFAFIGEAGSILQASAVGADGYGLILYTPEGAEMLAATGQGSARLEAALPRDGVYLMAIARQNAAKPYKLALAAESPDPFLWGFRQFAGYETLGANGTLAYWTCWVAPGSVLQYHLAGGQVQRLTVRRGGAGRWDFGPNSGYNFTTRLEGSTAVRTSEAGQVQTWSLDTQKSLGAYRGYHCR